MTLTRYEQNDGVITKQAPFPLDRRLEEIIAPMGTQLHCVSNTTGKMFLARDIALDSVAFLTKTRRDELSRALVECILRTTNESFRPGAPFLGFWPLSCSGGFGSDPAQPGDIYVLQVVASGLEPRKIIKVPPEEWSRQVSEFPLSEQIKSGAVFWKNPLLRWTFFSDKRDGMSTGENPFIQNETK